MRRQSLRTRLLAIVLIGIGLLTLVNLLISDWGLMRVRDAAILNSNQRAGSTEATQKITQIVAETQLFGLLASLAVVAVLGIAMALVLRHQFAQPLAALLVATKAAACGELRHITISGAEELAQLAGSFNALTDSVHASRAESLAANQRLELTVRERTADLELAVNKLEELYAGQQALLHTLREVSTPVIPVIAGVLAMPLIGQIDEARANNATRALLEGIERERAHTVLLDITGVPLIDVEVARALLRTVTAGRLLGAEVVLIGVTPEVAQAIVSLDLDLRGLRTAANLRSVIEQITRGGRC